MEESEIAKSEKIPSQDLADFLKLTTERCFYANQ
jgi:hypothetical protein